MDDNSLPKEQLEAMEPAELSRLMGSIMDLLTDSFEVFAGKIATRTLDLIEIPIDRIDPFPYHPFYVDDDDDMMDLAGSIVANGLLVPASVRRKDDGRYEMLSGHRRLRACQIAGVKTMRCEVLLVDDAQAAVFVVESNRQRPKICPGEKAYAFQLRDGAGIEYISENYSGEVGSFDRVDKAPGNREYQTRKCIRLTELIPELMEMVDKGEMGVRPAIELAKLPKLKQGQLWLTMDAEETTPSYSQAIRLRKLEAAHGLTEEKMREILRELKANQRSRVR